MSEADLEVKLRQKGVRSIDRVDEATLESLSIVRAPSSPADDE